MTMQGKAIDVIIGELDKLAMCKRGSLQTERHERSISINKDSHKLKEPILTVKQRKVIFAKERTKLLRILKYKPSDKLCHFDGSWGARSVTSRVHTDVSISKYNKACMKVLTHPKYAKYRKDVKAIKDRKGLLELELSQRGSILDHDFKDARMDFISEKVSLKDFQAVYDKLEQGEW